HEAVDHEEGTGSGSAEPGALRGGGQGGRRGTRAHRGVARPAPGISRDRSRAPVERGTEVGRGLEAHGRGGPLSASQLHVSTHPLLREKVTRLRDERTEPRYFRALVGEIATLPRERGPGGRRGRTS